VSARDWLAGSPGSSSPSDDGDQKHHRLGFPLLAAAAATADFFVNPAQVGTPGLATWAELREMADEHVHPVARPRSPRLPHQLSPARLREDLRRARLEIEEHVAGRDAARARRRT